MAETFNTESYTLQPTYKNNINSNKILLEAAPGTTVEDFVTVTNQADIPLTIHLYGADMDETSDGGVVSRNPNFEQKTIGKWMSIKNSRISLNPHEAVVIPFSASIPGNTALGIYKGAIVATKISSSEVSPGVHVSTRIALETSIKVTYASHRQRNTGDSIIVWYFWLSLVFFIGSMIYFVYTEKRKKIKH